MSQTISRGGPRSQIAIPAQGMIEFRDALTDLLDEFGTDDGNREEDKTSSMSYLNHVIVAIISIILFHILLSSDPFTLLYPHLDCLYSYFIFGVMS